jgi:hypothetical protein
MPFPSNASQVSELAGSLLDRGYGFNIDKKSITEMGQRDLHKLTVNAKGITETDLSI